MHFKKKSKNEIQIKLIEKTGKKNYRAKEKKLLKIGAFKKSKVGCVFDISHRMRKV